jgi:hypothetical protein
MSRVRVRSIIAIAAGLVATQAPAAPTVFSGVGGNNTSVTPGSANSALMAFQAAIGGANNGSGTGTYANGFRAINWDGVADVYAAPNLLPANFYNVNSPRGVVLITPGSGVEVSANAASGTPVNFGNINATYTGNFGVFSPVRLFTPIDSNILQIYFYKPGTTAPAMVRGFGAVFNDVESANTTSIRYFGFDGTDLGTYFAPTGNSGQSEFFGALFAPSNQPIGHVVITLGDAVLAAGTNESAFADLVVMDDIAYSEPRADDIFTDGFE